MLSRWMHCGNKALRTLAYQTSALRGMNIAPMTSRFFSYRGNNAHDFSWGVGRGGFNDDSRGGGGGFQRNNNNRGGNRGGGFNTGSFQQQQRDRKLEKERMYYFDAVSYGRKERPLNENQLAALEKRLFKDVKKKGASDRIDFESYDDVAVERSGIGVQSIPVLDSFDDLKSEEYHFPDWLVRNVDMLGIHIPTPVQKHGLPIALAGRDSMLCAQTGSGKTAAFLLPALSRGMFDPTSRHDDEGVSTPRMLVLAPTRELCLQTAKEAAKLCNRSPVRPVALFGGGQIYDQLDQLAKGADIIVATPGRLTDLVNRQILSLKEIQYLVLDEADRMLDMGFEPQIRKLVEQCDMKSSEDGRQTMMFSATFPKKIQMLARDFLRDYLWVAVGRVGGAAESVDQRILDVPNSRDKSKVLLKAIKDVPGKTLVFVQRKRQADYLFYHLEQEGYKAAAIHGDLSQGQREASLKSFRNGYAQVLVATDVAARGLDISDVTHVVNYDLPDEIDSYVHRIGRTGRAGSKGVATAFYNEAENAGLAKDILEIMKESKNEIPEWFSQHVNSMRGRSFSSKKYGRGGGGGRGGYSNNRGFGGSGGYGNRDGGYGGSRGGYGNRDGGYGGSRGGYTGKTSNQRFGQQQNDGPYGYRGRSSQGFGGNAQRKTFGDRENSFRRDTW